MGRNFTGNQIEPGRELVVRKSMWPIFYILWKNLRLFDFLNNMYIFLHTGWYPIGSCI